MDSGAPTGGFAYSNGLEEMFRLGIMRDAEDVLEHLRSSVRESFPGRELCFVGFAWRFAEKVSTLDLKMLVRERLITRPTASARKAETTRGVALRRILDNAHPEFDHLWDSACRSHAVLFGAACCVDGASRELTLTAFAVSQVSGVARAAVRLGRITPSEAEYVISSLKQDVYDAVHASDAIEFGDWYGFAPLWEFAQSRHEHRTGSLFIT